MRHCIVSSLGNIAVECTSSIQDFILQYSHKIWIKELAKAVNSIVVYSWNDWQAYFMLFLGQAL